MTTDPIPAPLTWSRTLAGHVASAAAGVLLPTSAAFAHAGHGLADPVHWHATDVLPWLGLVAVGALVYFARRK